MGAGRAGRNAAQADHRIVGWEPQPGPQTILLKCPADEIFFGGARGGGKSSGVQGDWLTHGNQYGRYARGIIFRKTYPEFEEILDQTHQVFPRFTGRYLVSKRTWIFRNGATLKLRYLEKQNDHNRYLGHQYTWMGFEELGSWPTSDPIDALKGALRSPHGVPIRWLATGNPGGAGHNWIKARFIDPAPPLTMHQDPVTKVWRVFIPAKLSDNKILMQNDPGYADRLRGVGAAWLVEAWLSGNWDIVAGGMFDDVWRREIHVIPPFEIPKTWRIDRAFDWGSSKPFSVGWWAESDGSQAPNGKHYPKGTLFRIGEWYGWNGKKPNEGLRMLAVEIARGIRDREQRMKLPIQVGPADPSIFAAENGVCIANDMALPPGSIRWEPADASPGSRKTGWERIRKMLKASLKHPMEEPGLFVFETCRQFIRTVPLLPRDLKDPDDVDTDAEDHIGDETRYRVMQVRRQVQAQKLSGV